MFSLLGRGDSFCYSTSRWCTGTKNLSFLWYRKNLVPGNKSWNRHQKNLVPEQILEPVPVKFSTGKRSLNRYWTNLVPEKVLVLVSKIFGIEKSLGTGIGKIWYQKKSTGIGMENICYWEKYRYWYRLKFWVPPHSASDPFAYYYNLSRDSCGISKQDMFGISKYFMASPLFMFISF